MTQESKKNDRLDDKPRWELLPLNLLGYVVEVYTVGAKKYGANNWQNLPDGYNRYKAAMFRHLVAFEGGLKPGVYTWPKWFGTRSQCCIFH